VDVEINNCDVFCCASLTFDCRQQEKSQESSISTACIYSLIVTRDLPNTKEESSPTDLWLTGALIQIFFGKSQKLVFTIKMCKVELIIFHVLMRIISMYLSYRAFFAQNIYN
jgi:hypothetical protein